MAQNKLWWCVTVILALRRWEQKGQEFKVILSYLLCLRPAHTIHIPCLKPTNVKPATTKILSQIVFEVKAIFFWNNTKLESLL